MSVWPRTIVKPLVTITPWSEESIGQTLAGISWVNPAAGVYPVANTAYFYPFKLLEPSTFLKMFVANGTPVSGNVDVGIYDKAFTRQVSMGSTAQAGATAIQIFDIADILLGVELFYLAIACDNTTASFRRIAPGQTQFMASVGCAEQASGFPLPAIATPTVWTGDFVPLFGITTRSVV